MLLWASQNPKMRRCCSLWVVKRGASHSFNPEILSNFFSPFFLDKRLPRQNCEVWMVKNLHFSTWKSLRFYHLLWHFSEIFALVVPLIVTGTRTVGTSQQLPCSLGESFWNGKGMSRLKSTSQILNISCQVLNMDQFCLHSRQPRHLHLQPSLFWTAGAFNFVHRKSSC